MRIAIRVRPGARADSVGGRWDGPRGASLLVAVRARAVDGAANASVTAVLAAALDVPRRGVTIVSGHRSRDKIVEVAGVDEADVARLRDAP